MGRCCFVPNCKTGYKRTIEKVSLFKPPRNALDEWNRKIPREDGDLTEKDLICEKHFHPDCILRVYDDGTIQYPLKIPRLVEGALPTIFPNCPAYLSTKRAPKRRLIIKKENPSKKRIKNLIVKCDNSTSTTNQSETVQIVVSKGIFSTIWEDPSVIKYPNQNWSCHKINMINKKCISISKMYIATNNTAKIEKQIIFHEDNSIMFLVQEKIISNVNLSLIPEDTISKVEDTIEMFDSMNVCRGGPAFSLYSPCNIKCRCATPDNNFSVWRHNRCPVLLKADREHCLECTTLKKTMRLNRSRQQQRNKVHLTGVSAIIHLRKVRDNQRKKLLRLKNAHLKLRNQLISIKNKIKTINAESINEKLQQLNLPLSQKLMISECIQICKYSKRNSRRYTGDWLILCLLLHIRSPPAYKFLQNNEILPLPSISTVRRYLSMINMKCGLDEQFFEALKLKLKNKNVYEKHGMLVFDEMHVRKSISVNVKTMKYYGIVDFGSDITTNSETKSTNELADHALVFMFTSLAENYSQPIAVYAANGPTKGTILASLITQVIIKTEGAAHTGIWSI